MAAACRCPFGQRRIFIHGRNPLPKPLWFNPGHPNPPLLYLPNKGKRTKERKTEHWKKGKKNSLGKARPPSSASSPEAKPSTSLGPRTLIAVMHPTIILSKNSTTASIALTSHKSLTAGALRLPAVLARSLPYPLYLRCPRLALHKQMVMRLPPPAVAPLALARLQPLRSAHSLA